MGDLLCGTCRAGNRTVVTVDSSVLLSKWRYSHRSYGNRNAMGASGGNSDEPGNFYRNCSMDEA